MWSFPDRRKLIFRLFPIAVPSSAPVDGELVLRPRSDIHVRLPHRACAVRCLDHARLSFPCAPFQRHPCTPFPPLPTPVLQEIVTEARQGAIITCTCDDDARTSRETDHGGVAGDSGAASALVRQDGPGSSPSRVPPVRKRRFFWEPDSDDEDLRKGGRGGREAGAAHDANDGAAQKGGALGKCMVREENDVQSCLDQFGCVGLSRVVCGTCHVLATAGPCLVWRAW